MTDRESTLKALHSELVGASCIMSNLPEMPGYNGSVLMIDDTEAARIVKAIDAARDFLEGYV